ncbi:hypothetical protein V6669_29910 [Paenibacillus sp. Y5S-9]|uniref:hypothetical protein n=1 Tax=Paenibacillus sp. Y5S-9 TaxID=3122489 RepID=UPI0030CEB0F0
MKPEISLSKIYEFLLKDVNYNYSHQGTLIIDLVTVMGSIYIKDVETHKNNDKPRSIKINIPVFNYNLWSQTNITELVEKIANWVSEDQYKINFEHNSTHADPFFINGIGTSMNSVTLFSGGLDSFAGAFFNYKNNVKSDYLGFINKSEERTKQVEVSKFYRHIFDSATEIVFVEKPIVKKRTYIQSTRSLLYLALAIAKAYFNTASDVYLFENGILSLNPELNNRYTTKTTHPKTIYMYRSLLGELNIAININHPFLFYTKGQIVDNMNGEFKNVIKDTFTCGQGRSHPERTHSGQCGICIPCLLRKISLAAYDNEKYDVNYQHPYNLKVKMIKEDAYRKDYESNLNYFKNYYELIRSKKIFTEVLIRKKYYEENSNFRMSNEMMFGTFAQEYERFMEKYDPY